MAFEKVVNFGIGRMKTRLQKVGANLLVYQVHKLTKPDLGV